MGAQTTMIMVSLPASCGCKAAVGIKPCTAPDCNKYRCLTCVQILILKHGLESVDDPEDILTPILHFATRNVRSTQIPFLMCTLEIPQKLLYKFLLLTFVLFALLLSCSLNYDLIIYCDFCFFFQSYELDILELL